MKQKTFLKGFFWFTFAAFLAPSIPHIAYFFHAWEPANAYGTEGVLWWVVSYAIAISVDGTIIWLSHTAAAARREQTASKGYLLGLWSFILFLTAVSWLINWLYAKHDSVIAVTVLSGAISEHVLGVSMQTVTPIIASMFPVLAIMFTLMADKVIANKATTPELLQAEVDRLEAIKGVQSRLNKLREAAKGPGLIAALASKAKEVKAAVKEVVNDSDKASPVATPEPIKTEVKTEPLTPTHRDPEPQKPEAAPVVGSTITTSQKEEPITDPQIDTANVTTFPGKTAAKRPKTTVKLNDLPVAIDINSRRKPLTTSEAMTVLGVSEKTVREWKKSGKLSASADGKGITASSVRRMVESRQERVS